MDYDNKNSIGDEKNDLQFTAEEAITFAGTNPNTTNSNAKLLVQSDYTAEPYVSKADINLADLADCEYFHDLDADVITCVKTKAEFNLVYSFSDSDIVEGVAEIDEIVIATSELLTTIADNSQHYKKLSKDSPRMPDVKSINMRRKNE